MMRRGGADQISSGSKNYVGSLFLFYRLQDKQFQTNLVKVIDHGMIKPILKIKKRRPKMSL